MINNNLYQALNRILGQTGRVVDEDMPCSFSCPPSTRTLMRRQSKKYAYADVWGEKYEYNCPMCGDTRRRLVIGHQIDMCVKVKTAIYHFGNVFKCYNESCDIRGHIAPLSSVDRPLELSELYDGVEVKPKTFTTYGKPCEDFPGHTVPIISTEVPDYVIDYLHQRGFNPVELHDKYLVRYAEKGTVWRKGNKDAPSESDRKDNVFYEDRILIPIVQRGKMVSWQARKLAGDMKRFKYINGKGHRKSEYLYNMDTCLYEPNIVLFEGVTDVWRWGDGAMAMFGKKLSVTQAEIMKILWGWKGWNSSCVVCLDPDAVGSSTDKWNVDYLRRKRIFTGGVASAELRDKDPADHTIGELREIIEEARSRCK